MNTGHSGCCGTMHANRVEDVGARLEALGVTAGLGREAVQTQAAAALDVVLHLVRDRDGHRRLSCIGAVATGDSGRVEVRPGLLLARDGTMVEGPSSAALERRLAAVA